MLVLVVPEHVRPGVWVVLHCCEGICVVFVHQADGVFLKFLSYTSSTGFETTYSHTMGIDNPIRKHSWLGTTSALPAPFHLVGQI